MAYIYNAEFENKKKLTDMFGLLPESNEHEIIHYQSLGSSIQVEISIRVESDEEAIRSSIELEEKISEIIGSPINPKLEKIERLR